jgi:hypothetical protein
VDAKTEEDQRLEQEAVVRFSDPDGAIVPSVNTEIHHRPKGVANSEGN